MTEQPCWVAVKDVCHCYGNTFDTAKNRIAASTFPVRTYKVGKILVIDREVHDEYFRREREAGLLALKTTKG